MTGLSALLATSPEYLQELGLLKSNHKQKKSAQLSRASLLLLVALRTLPKLPYYLAADLWRLEALSGNLTNITDLNALWRRYRSVFGLCFSAGKLKVDVIDLLKTSQLENDTLMCRNQTEKNISLHDQIFLI